MTKPNQSNKNLSRQQQLGMYLSMGLRISGTVIGGAGLGYAIDYGMGNEKPIATLIMGSVAILVALIQFIREFW